MIGLRLLICLSVLLGVPTHALAEVHADSTVYTHTVKRWKRAIKTASFESSSWLWNLNFRDRHHKHGSRDSILMVPDAAIPEDITLIVWFHGCNGFSERTFRKRIVPQMEALVEEGNSVAIALPELPWSTNTDTRCKRQGRVWRSAGALEEYVSSLRGQLKMWAQIKHGTELGQVHLVFVGHSAGGSALMSAAAEGGLCRLAPEAVIWSDASYGYWLDTAWRSCLSRLDTELHVLVRKWNKPYHSAQRVMKRARRTPHSARIFYQPLNGKYWSHTRIGDRALLLTGFFPPGC